MNQLFNIQPNNVDTSQFRLYVEISLHGMCIITFGSQHTFTGVSCFNFDEGTTIKTVYASIENIIATQLVLKQPFKKIDIIYAFPDSIFVPYELMNEQTNKEMLEFVYGDSQEEIVKHDLVSKHNLYNVYRIPERVRSLLNGTFPEATHTHLYSILPDIMQHKDGNHLYCIFGTNYIIAMLKIEGKLQVIKDFTYKTSADAAYHLLNVCANFDVAAAEVVLHLSGMIDKVSSLYEELYRYFLHLQFEALPENFQYADGIKNYPSQFFSHLFSIASCV